MAEIDPFQSMRSLADLWGRSGTAFLESQEGLFRDFAEKMRGASESGAGELHENVVVGVRALRKDCQGRAGSAGGSDRGRDAGQDLRSKGLVRRNQHHGRVAPKACRGAAAGR